MKIGIDISQIVYGTGVSTYTKYLVKSLLKTDTHNQYILFAGTLRQKATIRNYLKTLTGKFTAHILPLPPQIASLLWNNIHEVPIEKLIGELDIFHSSDWTQPPSKAIKVTTIHDLAPIIYPQYSDPHIVSTHKKRLKWVKKEIDVIIAPSHSTEDDIVKYLGIEPNKIKVIHEAPSSEFHSSSKSQIAQTLSQLRISDNYFLVVGTGPRKNLANLLKAFSQIYPETNIKLAVVGNKPNIQTPMGVLFIDYVSTNQLVDLYSGAEALLYPSLYEGFGLPILEAFACGTSVLTSNISSMPEISGNAAVLVDPHSVDSITEGIRKIVLKKAHYITLAQKRVKDFSWEKTAAETLKIYNSLKL